MTRVRRLAAGASSRLRARYGAGPGHLFAMVASLSIAAAAVVGWFQLPSELINVLTWFGASIILHDFVLLPLYSALDRVTIARLPPRSAAYVRVPAIVSGLLLLVLFPTVFGLGAGSYLGTSGVAEHGYLARWLLLTGALFVVAGIAYVVGPVRRQTR